VTALGVAAANGGIVPDSGRGPGGFFVYVRPLSSGFFLFAEGRPGPSNRPVARTTFNWSPDDPNLLPDFQIWVSKDLGGNPTDAVCDTQVPDIGGVKALDPPIFGSQTTANRINDLSCRFDARLPANGDFCTIDRFGNFALRNPSSTVQFCSSAGVGAEIRFPRGVDTKVTVRLRDNQGNVGPAESMYVRIP
jgi:hypothetical protein